MRKRSNVRKRMLATALSMILTVSLIFGVAPIQVRAEENAPQTETGDPGITDGNQAPENGEQGGGNPEQKPETLDDGQLPNGGGSSEGNHLGEDGKPVTDVPEEGGNPGEDGKPVTDVPEEGGNPGEDDKPVTDVPEEGGNPGEDGKPATDVPEEGGNPVADDNIVSNQPVTDPGGKEPAEEEDAEYFAVSFYSQGELVEVQSVKAGEKASAPAVPVREGYIFLGWAESEEDGAFFDFDTEIDGIRDLYARWEPAAEEGQAARSRKAAARIAAEVEYSTDGGQTWTEADTLLDAFYGGMSAPRYEIRLLRDITIDNSNWGAPWPLTYNNELVLDGQGHTITRGDSGINSIVVYGSSTLTLKNVTIDGGAVWSGGSPDQRSNSGISCSGNQQILYVYGGGTLILEEGAVIENCDIQDNGFNGAVELGHSSDGPGTLIMKAGSEIRNNNSYAGGAVNVREGSTFRMEGGKIHGNYASQYGGGAVNAYGNFIMTGGEISGNVAANLGGGVCINGGDGEMTGGRITGNSSLKYGGGVAIRDEEGTSRGGSFQLSNGEISGNTAASLGGGVIAFHENSELRAAGGSITGNTSGSGGGGVYVYFGKIKVSGNTQITSNLKAGEASNVYLREGKVIEVTGDITSANIGVAASYGEGIFSSGWGTQMGEADPADCFKSDNAAYSVVIDDAAKEAKLVSAGEEPDPGPENPDPGEIKTETAVEEGAPKTEMLVTEAELTDMVLTEAEKAEVENGTDITIRLAISDADSTVTDQDKGVAEGARKEYTIGKYLDISLLKIIGDAQSNIRETTKMIRIKLEIPDDLKNKDSEKTRKYAILRVHEGVAEILNDLDTDPNTITIETNRFSTYAVLYNDTEEGGNTGEDDNQGGNTGGNGNQGGNTGGNGNQGGNTGENDNQGGSTGGDDNQGGSTGGSDNSQSSGGNGDASGSAGADAAPTAPGAASNAEKAPGSSAGAEKAAAGSAGANTSKEKDGEPKTGDSTAIELYATVAMIAGLSYLLLYFGSDSRGMTEEEKKEIVSKLIRWSRRGGRIYRLLALAAIFLVLVYYHSIGKKTAVNWKEVYEK